MEEHGLQYTIGDQLLATIEDILTQKEITPTIAAKQTRDVVTILNDDIKHFRSLQEAFKHQPHKSCCNKADCYPTEVKYEDNHWYALRREDGNYIRVPDNKVERNRDNPDGRIHRRGPTISRTLCFVSLGGGI
jgi:hypothetical protein